MVRVQPRESSMSKLTLPILLLALFGATPSLAQDAPQSFGQWHVTCRDDGYCAAATAALDPGSPPPFVLHVGRPARQTYWEVGVAATTAIAAPASAFTAKLGSQSFNFAPPAEIGAFGAVADYYFLGSKAEKLLDGMAHGSALSVDFTGLDASPITTRFSLDGLSAALIAIDTRQRRVGAERVAGPPPVGLARLHLATVKIAGGAEPSAGPPLLTATIFDPPLVAFAFAPIAHPSN